MPFPDEGLTCGALLNIAGIPNADADASTYDQWLVTGLFCGCPPPVDGGCDLCQDGSEPPDLSLVPFPDNSNFTYGDLLLDAGSSSTDPEAATCDQWLHCGKICGCPPPTGGCSICNDGSQPPDLSLVPFPDAFNTTCGEFQDHVAFVSTDPDALTTCDDYLDTGVLCGCPLPTGGYSLCYDGSSPPDLDLSPEYFDGVTCGDYVKFAAIPIKDTDDITCEDLFRWAFIDKCNLYEDEVILRTRILSSLMRHARPCPILLHSQQEMNVSHGRPLLACIVVARIPLHRTAFVASVEVAICYRILQWRNRLRPALSSHCGRRLI
jgi:hypothetical protein